MVIREWQAQLIEDIDKLNFEVFIATTDARYEDVLVLRHRIKKLQNKLAGIAIFSRAEKELTTYKGRIGYS